MAQKCWFIWTLALTLCLAAGSGQAQQTSAPAPAAPPSPAKPQAPSDKPSDKDNAKGETRITPDQAKQLFSYVDQFLKFSSDETGLPIKSDVKRQLTTRAAVESYLREKFDEDEGAKRMQRSEIVLKKFGLLDRDFDLKPFLLSLLKEQIEAYYDPKSKTVNLLDWVDVDEQKPVLAHELTHALQDQRVDLDKWSDQTPPDVSTDTGDDAAHIAKDELDTAREAVTEGQAMAVMMDSLLKPMGHSLLKDPEVVEALKEQMTGTGDSPVLARAPLLLSESMMFPYREGLSFEQDVWMDKGQNAAFAGALDHPPTSSWEIMNPRAYEKGQMPPVPLLPNIHPLVDTAYRPYDIGQVGQLDVHILTGIFGGEGAARDLTPAWDGGIYWAGQLRNATPVEQASTKSVALLYLSIWKSSASAAAFARLYEDELGRQYSGVKLQSSSQTTDMPASDEQVYTTSEGPMVITTRGKSVFVAESFDLPLARQLTTLILNAQGAGEMKLAATPRPRFVPPPSFRPVAFDNGQKRAAVSRASAPVPDKLLTGSLVRFLSDCGVMKFAVDASIQSVK
ncbi:MAG: hypothetical protein WCC26_07015 [Terracidiphilus sp.]